MLGRGRSLRVPLLEREHAVTVVRGTLERASSGARVLAVCGDPGIGRTRLLEVAADEAAARGMTVRAARAERADRETPFAVLHALLGDLAPGLAEAGAEQDAVRRHLLAGALGDARSGPVAWLIDDLHCADAASMALLAEIARQPGLALALMVTAPRPPAALPGEVLWLEPLGAPALARLIGGDEAAGRRARELTGGSPLLAADLLDVLARSPATPADLTPDAVARAVLTRLAALPEAAQALARAIALFEGAVELEHATAVAGLEPAAAAAAAAELRGAGLLREGPRLAFAHERHRQTVADDATSDVRADAHARAAEVLTRAGAPATRIAEHLREAPPRGDPDAAAILHEAGRARMARGEDLEAAVLFARALAEPAPEDRVGRVLLDLGEAQVRVGSPAAERHLQAAVAALDDPLLLARAVSSLALRSITHAPQPSAAALAESVLADLAVRVEPELTDRLIAKLLLTLGPGTPEHAERLRRVASHGVRALGPLTLVHWLAVAIREAARPAAELAGWGRQAAREARGFWRQDTWEMGTIAGTLTLTDRGPEALTFIDAQLELARATGNRIDESSALALRAREHLRRGRLAEAEADAREALAVDALRIEPSPISYFARAILVEVLCDCGRVDEAAAIVADMPERPPAIAGVGFPATRLRLATGDDAAAVQMLLADGERHEAAGITNPALAPWRSIAVGPLLRLGEHARAGALAREELVRARRFGAPSAIGAAERAAGLAQGGASGIERLQRAAAAMHEAGAHLQEAWVLHDLGAALRRAGRRTDAREALSEAADLGQKRGADPLVASALEELRACGARPRRAHRTGVDALTPRERRVAELAADGLTNRAIAGQLFVTANTVEMHLSNAYRKLEIAGRAQLAAALGRQS